MTLTRLLPSLRRSIPDPLTPDLWPEYTSATTTDVFVAASGLPADLRAGDLLAVPCRGELALRDLRPAAEKNSREVVDSAAARSTS